MSEIVIASGDKFKTDCIYFMERDFNIAHEWCIVKEKYINKCPKKCKHYDYTPIQLEVED